MRVLILVHAHERFSVGGAENAAFSLFRELSQHQGIEAWILAAMHTSRGALAHGELRSMEGTDREYLIGTDCEWYRFSNTNIAALRRGLQRLLDHVQPDVIHLQHYSLFGIDVIPLMQTLSPKSRVVVTLHEYLALCMHNGQMVTPGQLKLCHKSTPLACSLCFPERSAQDMFLRQHYIGTILQSCDALISPSEFLIQRYRDSGIDHPNFLMIENGLPPQFASAERQRYLATHSRELNRFGYFGQLNIYKGPLVLLKAVALLQDRGITNFSVSIHGANLEHQPQDFQDEFESTLEQVRERVSMRGSYRQQDMEALMLDVDWMVIPSIWWENSPVVIQEAFFYGRPVLGGDIGGMAEKIDGRGGLTFAVRSPSGLAALMERCIGNQSLHQALRESMPAPVTASVCAERHINLYQGLTRQTPSAAAPANNVV
jgi:glycosyltransferase involved in cell wall biosynthesis